MRLWIRRPKTFRGRGDDPRFRDELNETQAKVPGFDRAAYKSTHIALIGAGGINSNVAHAINRKGAAQILSLIDDDRLARQNLTRQLFAPADIGKYKTHALGKRLARETLFPIVINSYPFRFQELLERGYDLGKPNLLICGVDNNPTRRAVSEYALEHHIPVIHAAVARDGSSLYVMVQEPTKACWGCAFPQYVNDSTYPCNLPGIIDVLQVVSGLIVYAIDSLICTRRREWNVREIFLHGSLPDRTRQVERRGDCLVCAGAVRSVPLAA